MVDAFEHDELRVREGVDEWLGRTGEVAVADDDERRARHLRRVCQV